VQQACLVLWFRLIQFFIGINPVEAVAKQDKRFFCITPVIFPVFLYGLGRMSAMGQWIAPIF